MFYGTELPLLENKGYLAAFSKKLAAGWKDDIKKADPKGFDPLTCGSLHDSALGARAGSEDRRDILTTLRVQT